MMSRLAGAMCLALMFLSSQGYAVSMSEAMNEAKALGNSLKQEPTAATKQVVVDTIPDYTESPPEVNYNSTTMEQAADQKAASDPNTQLISNVADRKYAEGITADDPLLQQYADIQSEADTLLTPTAGQYEDCSAETTPVSPSYETEEICTYSRRTYDSTCTKKIRVTVPDAKLDFSREGSWTSMSGDCKPDTWTSSVTVDCGSGYIANIESITREAKFYSNDPWNYILDWTPNTSSYNARTSISCTGAKCTYKTAGVQRKCKEKCTGVGRNKKCETVCYADWGSTACSGDQGLYSRLKVQVLCAGAPVVPVVTLDNQCTTLEERAK